MITGFVLIRTNDLEPSMLCHEYNKHYRSDSQVAADIRHQLLFNNPFFYLPSGFAMLADVFAFPA